MVEIRYVKWGLANRFDDYIEMNIALKEDPKLHNAILDHELGHKKSNSFRQDLAHDLTPINKLSQKELLVFMIKHPTTFTQILPFYWSPRRKKLVYDLNMILIYVVVLSVFGLFFLLL